MTLFVQKTFDNSEILHYNILRNICERYAMLLNLSKIINVESECLDFDFAMELSDMEVNSQKPAQQSVSVSGTVANIAGVLNLRMQIDTVLTCICDRCLKVFQLPKKVFVDSVIAEEIFDQDDDNIILMQNDCVDLYEVAETAFILSLDSKTLCRDDCKGLCPTCGADLNLGDCGCEDQGDPRLAIFKQLLKDKKQ